MPKVDKFLRNCLVFAIGCLILGGWLGSVNAVTVRAADDPLVLEVKVDDRGQIRVGDLYESFRQATGSTLSTPAGRADELFKFGRGEEAALWIAKRVGVVSDYSYSGRLLRITFTQPDAAESRDAMYDWMAKTFGLELYRLFFAPETEPSVAPDRILVLVHGLHSSSQDLLPLGQALANEQTSIAYFEYPNRSGLERAAQELGTRLVDLQQRFPSSSIRLVGHSMGGLVARYVAVAPRETIALEIQQVITIGTPHRGSSVATVGHWLTITGKKGRSLIDWVASGFGEAVDDVKPDSVFLRKLDGFERKPGLRVDCLAGRSVWTSPDAHAELLTEAKSHPELLNFLASPELDPLQGDGAVTVESALWPHASSARVFDLNHIEIIRLSETGQPSQEVVVYIQQLLDPKSTTGSR